MSASVISVYVHLLTYRYTDKHVCFKSRFTSFLFVLTLWAFYHIKCCWRAVFLSCRTPYVWCTTGAHSLGTVDSLEGRFLVGGHCPVYHGMVSSVPGHSLSTRCQPQCDPKNVSRYCQITPLSPSTSHTGVPQMNKMCYNLFPFQMFRLCILSRWNKCLCFEFLVRHFSTHPKGNSWNKNKGRVHF